MSIDLRERLNATLDSGQARGLHAAVVVRNGQILLEHYGAGEDYSWGTSLGFVTFGLDALHDLRSVTKSITALLYGIALGERRVRYGRHKIVFRTERSKSVLLVAGLVPPDSAQDKADAPRRLSMATSLRDRQLRVLPATEDRWGDVVACFGRRGNDPEWCWCQRFVGAPPDGDNRAALHRQITAAAVPVGLVAFADEQPVGWTRVSPRSELPGVLSNRALKRFLPEDSDTWWVTCFVVNAGHRGHGVGHALLNAAVSHARDYGASAVEGHPVDVDKLKATSVSGSALFTGTLAMFAAAGFTEIGWTFPSRPVMRLQL